MLDVHNLKPTKTLLPEKCKCKKRRGCARLWQNWLHHITEPIAINAACVLMSDTYLLETIFLTGMNSSTDITSQQKQNSSQHNTVSEVSKENVCQHTEMLQLYFHQVVRFKLPWHRPFVLHHFRKAYVLFSFAVVYLVYCVFLLWMLMQMLV